jgi:DNA processing protein
MDTHRLSLLALHFIPGVGDFAVKQLVSYCGSAERVFNTPKGKLLKIPGIGPKTVDAISVGKPMLLAEKEVKRAEKENVRLVFYTDKDYPSRLKQIPDAPSMLYIKGNVHTENARAVAIVGTRQATSYGKERVEELLASLVPHQPLIISGLAYGIDIHAHRQSLKHNLPTVGVLGSGIDVIYPAAHKDTAKKMLDRGGLITENPFGTKPDAHNFPERNRIIAGLCDALIVIEAASTGGALITAEIANSYNRDVFAVPGSIGLTYSEGCNHLIKTNRAHLLTSVKDLEYIMNWTAEKAKPASVKISFDGLPEDEQAVLTQLQIKGPVPMDELSWKTGLAVSALASTLLNLEFKGLVKALPGKQYQLATRA